MHSFRCIPLDDVEHGAALVRDQLVALQSAREQAHGLLGHLRDHTPLIDPLRTGAIRRHDLPPESGSPRQLPQQLVVVCMRADPEPDDLVRVAHPEGTAGESDPHRVDRTTGVHLLEAKARM
jgi:hypothetical protein